MAKRPRVALEGLRNLLLPCGSVVAAASGNTGSCLHGVFWYVVSNSCGKSLCIFVFGSF